MAAEVARVAHRGLRKYLLPGETPVAEIRHHRIVLLKPFAITVAALALVVWLDISVSDAGSAILPYLWWAWLAVVGWAAWQWIEWRHTRVVAVPSPVPVCWSGQTHRPQRDRTSRPRTARQRVCIYTHRKYRG